MAWDRIRQFLFGEPPVPPAYPIEPTDQQQIEMIAAKAQRMVDVVNESIQIAGHSKNIETRRSRIRVARERIAQLQELAADYPFLKIMQLVDVEHDLRKIDQETDSLEVTQESEDKWVDDFLAECKTSIGKGLADDLKRIIDIAIQTSGASLSIESRRANLALARGKLEDLRRLLPDEPGSRATYIAEAESALSTIEHETERLASQYSEGGSARGGAFLRASLTMQCDALKVPLEVIKVERREGQWIVSGTAHKRPENAALSHYQSQGWIGTACEGSAVLMLMKAACLDYLAKVNPFGRQAACTNYFEAQCSVQQNHRTQILDEITRTGEDSLRANLLEIVAQPEYAVLYPAMEVDALIGIWRTMTPVLLSRFAGHIFDDFGNRAGWPDLTLARGSDLLFVEVKTTDKLHASQRDVILGILQPTGTGVRVLRLKPS
jgi:hypothetical protein